MKHNGFTLIEILVVTAIVGIILSFGMTIDVNAVKGDTLQAEKLTIVSALERARSHAMANMFDDNHGFCYIEPNYVVFTGSNCVNTNSELIPANVNIASDASTSFPDKIVFERLTGRTTPTTLQISHGLFGANIKINNEGTIDW